LYNIFPIKDDFMQRPEIVRCLQLLRIGKVDVRVYMKVDLLRRVYKNNSPMTVYDSVQADTNRCLVCDQITRGDTIATYTVYQIVNDAAWNEEEIKRIQSFFHVLFLMNSRSNLVSLADYIQNNDTDFDLPNMVSFMKDIDRMVRQGVMAQYGTARFNIKDYKYINARLGYSVGTTIMKKYIQAIQEVLGENGIIYRIGGDNFLVLFKIDVYEQLKNVLVRCVLRTEITAMPELVISSRTGYYFPKGQDSLHLVCESTHDAGLLAKQLKYEDYLEYNDEQRRQLSVRKQTAVEAVAGMAKEEFIVYYQPKMNSKTGELIGAEALCRWGHNGQMIPPSEFISVLEQSNDICQLDFYMLEHVCRDIRRWMDTGYDPVRVSVNFSRINLSNAHLAKKIIEIIDRYKIPHAYIAIELTETTADVSFQILRDVITELNDAEICTAIDDFGAGYSSLNLIRDLPWKVLKLDRSLLPVIGDTDFEQKRTMLKHVIAMGHALGLECIAEGAESKEQVELLSEVGCFLVQGFYYGRPLPKEDFERQLTIGNEEY
ncbi:MAG: GGDEF domain-containing phosphodiesterase, partial [Lachnospiraceae bacterium]|nr:GGDEF domain-containing phosphodiesterase [Lachnospiraceae bacterium]